MINFFQTYWTDLLVSIVGLSAFIIYFFQKRDRLYSAGTLIIGQIDLIEKSISALKNDPQLGNIVVYHSNHIIKENMWEQYKHLFVKRLTSSEYELLQRFFDHAEQLERARTDVINTIAAGWADKSSAEHQTIAQMIVNDSSIEAIETFRNNYRPLDLVFTPDIVIKAITKSLQNFNEIKGTTAYAKIQKKSYSK